MEQIKCEDCENKVPVMNERWGGLDHFACKLQKDEDNDYLRLNYDTKKTCPLMKENND